MDSKLEQRSADMWTKLSKSHRKPREPMPPLTQEQIAFARRQVGRWMRHKSKYEPHRPVEDHLTIREWMVGQGASDADHSALLWRLLAGKDPLPDPPPLKNGYPDYPD